MLSIKPYQFWFVTGSQHLYGPETIEEVAEHSRQITAGLNSDDTVPFEIVFKPVLTTADEIRKLAIAANSDENCGGIITWMHTFSLPKCGSPVCRSSASRCCTWQPNLTAIFHGIPSTWIS